MGRTKRKRQRTIKNEPLDHDQDIKNLKIWMTNNSWNNFSHLTLRNFTQTGRGLTSKRNINIGDILIQIPLELLITYKTIIEESNIISQSNNKLKIHDILAIFLVLEKHKNGKSKWKHYIKTLPYPAPILPLFALDSEIKSTPQDLQLMTSKGLANLNESFHRTRESILASKQCECCKVPLHCVLTWDVFKWAYIIVNTRAVYVDPHHLNIKEYNNHLSDDPSMALCPFLDLFNHDFNVKTNAGIVTSGGKVYFQLTTLTSYKKYEQIFISYGAHENEKLLMEYGFYIPGNTNDVVKFHYKDILKLFDVKLSEVQYKYIKEHDFNNNDKLYVDNNSSVSYNLKAFLFVMSNYSNVRNYNSVIFGESYPSDFEANVIKCGVKVLLSYKLRLFESDVERLSLVAQSESGLLILDYLRYRVRFVNDLLCRCTF